MGATDEDGGAITFSIDDTTNYAIDSSTGAVTLTATGAARETRAETCRTLM